MRVYIYGFILIIVSSNVFGVPNLYSGGVSVFDTNDEYIALHRHGVRYSQDDQKFKSYSFIELVNKRLNFNKAIRIENTPKFNALKWSDNGKYLVGISNIKQKGMPNIVVYNSAGLLITTEKIKCNIEFNPFFCTQSQELHWAYEQLNDLEVRFKNHSLEVFLGSDIIKIGLKKQN